MKGAELNGSEHIEIVLAEISPVPQVLQITGRTRQEFSPLQEAVRLLGWINLEASHIVEKDIDVSECFKHLDCFLHLVRMIQVVGVQESDIASGGVRKGEIACRSGTAGISLAIKR